jgi:serine/threonine-protein kinase/endoribonuclease IRE1
MVSDFGLSKRLDAGVSSFQTVGISGTHGWRAPEIVLLCLSTEPAATSPTSASSLLRMTRAVDSFALGCVVYYILTRGLHPFGDILSREMNIANDCTAMERSIEPESLDLVSKLIAFKPENRLDLLKTLQHVYFWTSQDCLYFLQELSDKLDALGPEDTTVQSFERIAHVILKRDWDLIIERGILEETFNYRQYDTSSLKDLLRVIRNKARLRYHIIR